MGWTGGGFALYAESMRIGIDTHIITPQHKRYNPYIARYTEQLVASLIEADTTKEHTWVLFFDSRMHDTKKFTHFANGKPRPNVEIKHFPFIQYRIYMPVLYSHLLISGVLRSANLDVFHSPEGLIPFAYPGKIITTFHYVPRGKLESNLFVRTFMLGARVAFAQLCKRAERIIVAKDNDKKLLIERHSYPAERVVVMGGDPLNKANWTKRANRLLEVYQEVAQQSPVSKDSPEKTSKKEKS